MGYLLRNGMLKAGWEDDGPIQAPAGMGHLLRNGMLKRGWEKEGPVQVLAGMGHLLRIANESDSSSGVFSSGLHLCGIDAARARGGIQWGSPTIGSAGGLPDVGDLSSEDRHTIGASTEDGSWHGYGEAVGWYNETHPNDYAGTGSSEACSFDVDAYVGQESCAGDDESGQYVWNSGQGTNRISCGKIELPSTAANRDCFTGTPPTGWPPNTSCPPPDVNQKVTLSACSWVPETLAILKSRFITCTFEDDLVDLLADALCVLIDNIDLVEWVTCLVDVNAVPCMTGAVIGSNETFIKCYYLLPDNSSFTLGNTIYWAAHSNSVQRYLKSYRSSAPEDRLCAVIRTAALLYHEMTHRCSVGGIYNLDVQGTFTEDACEPTWLAYSTMEYALFIRYPLSRRGACCGNACLRDLAWSSNVDVFLEKVNCAD